VAITQDVGHWPERSAKARREGTVDGQDLGCDAGDRVLQNLFVLFCFFSPPAASPRCDQTGMAVIEIDK